MVTRIGAVRGESCALALGRYMVGWRTIVQRVLGVYRMRSDSRDSVGQLQIRDHRKLAYLTRSSGLWTYLFNSL